ncbi:HAD family hydrolase [Streptomyces sp. UC4497]
MSETRGDSPRNALSKALRRADGVVFDFDGPVCRLFPHGTAQQTAAIKGAVWGNHEQVPPSLTKVTDTHDLLNELRTAPPEVIARVTELITAYEQEAVYSASATPHIAALVARLGAAGKGLAIASNNAAEPIRSFLRAHGMDAAFGTRVYGRDPLDLSRMKPAPDTLLGAMAALELPAERCLLVGDRASDLQAASAARMAFIGCTDDREELSRMSGQGASLVFTSLLPVIEAVVRDGDIQS